MSWVEELTPEDEVEVEVIYPQAFVDHNLASMKKYSAAAAYYCKAAATLGQKKVRFRLPEISVLQVQALEVAMKHYGVEITHRTRNGERWFYAEVSGLIELMEKGLEEEWK